MRGAPLDLQYPRKQHHAGMCPARSDQMGWGVAVNVAKVNKASSHVV